MAEASKIVLKKESVHSALCTVCIGATTKQLIGVLLVAVNTECDTICFAPLGISWSVWLRRKIRCSSGSGFLFQIQPKRSGSAALLQSKPIHSMVSQRLNWYSY
jgi:hypothetical protein